MALATSAFADGIILSENGKTVTLNSTHGTSSEIFSTISEAYKFGFKDAEGADFFTEYSKREGSLSVRRYFNEALTATRTSAFALVYKISFTVSKKSDIVINNSLKELKVSGEAARLLLGSLKTVEISEGRNTPPGISRASTASGNVVCSRVISPGAVTSCLIKF